MLDVQVIAQTRYKSKKMLDYQNQVYKLTKGTKKRF